MGMFLDLKNRNSEGDKLSIHIAKGELKEEQSFFSKHKNLIIYLSVILVVTLAGSFMFAWYTSIKEKQSDNEIAENIIPANSTEKNKPKKAELATLSTKTKEEEGKNLKARLKEEYLNKNKENMEKIAALEIDLKSLKTKHEELEQFTGSTNEEISALNKEKEELVTLLKNLKKTSTTLSTKNTVLLEQLKITKNKLIKTITSSKKEKRNLKKELAKIKSSKKLEGNSIEVGAEGKMVNIGQAVNIMQKDLLKEKEDMFYNLGATYEDLGLYNEAATEYKKALEINPAAPDIHYNLAIIYDDYLDDDTQAIFHYKKYMKLNPNESLKVKEWIKNIKEK